MLEDAFVKGDVAVHWCSLGLVCTSTLSSLEKLSVSSWSRLLCAVSTTTLKWADVLSFLFPHRRELAAGGSSRTHTQQQEWWRSECSLCFCSRSSVRVRVPKSWTHQSDLQGRWKKTFLVLMDDGPWSSWHTRGVSDAILPVLLSATTMIMGYGSPDRSQDSQWQGLKIGNRPDGPLSSPLPPSPLHLVYFMEAFARLLLVVCTYIDATLSCCNYRNYCIV